MRPVVRVFAFVVTLAGAVFGSQAVARAQRPTVVRVVGPGGKPLAGARVYFMRSPMPNKAPTQCVERLRFVTDVRGRVRADVPFGGVWSAWGAWDDGKRRFASPLQTGVTLGRPMRLNLEPFEVPFVRLLNLGPWRGGEIAKVVGEPAIAFVSETKPSTVFTLLIPAGEKPVVRVPDLPIANYFPTLVDDSGGFLDMVYFSPVFHVNNPQAELVYERNYPLKQVTLSEPKLAHLTVTGSNGDPLAGARLVIRSQTSSYPLFHENVRVSDKAGRISFIVPYRPKWKPYELEPVLYAPGCEPLLFSVPAAQLKATKDALSLQRQMLPSRLQLDWKLTGLLAHDKVFLYAQARSKATIGRPPVVADRLMPVTVAEDGGLALPAPRVDLAAGTLAGRYELYVVRHGRQICVFRGYPSAKLPAKWSLDVSTLPTLDLKVTTAAKHSVNGGRVAIVPRFESGSRPRRVAGLPGVQVQVSDVGPGSPDQVSVIEDSLDHEGSCKRLLLPGRYLLFVRHDKLGDVFEEVDIPSGKKLVTHTLILHPFWVIRGRVVDSDNDPVEGNPIESTPSSVVKSAQSVQFLLWRFMDAPRARSDGSFRLRVSSYINGLNVYATRNVDGAYQYANRLVAVGNNEFVELKLRSN